jgi:hypothetical protein
LRRLFGIELRRLVIQDLVEVPDHGVGLEVAAVVELHVAAQRDHPARGVALVDFPARGEAGHEHRRLIGRRQVPIDQPVIDRVAHEAHALAALVGLAGRQRHVGCGHADAQGALGERCLANESDRKGEHGRA